MSTILNNCLIYCHYHREICNVFTLLFLTSELKIDYNHSNFSLETNRNDFFQNISWHVKFLFFCGMNTIQNL